MQLCIQCDQRGNVFGGKKEKEEKKCFLTQIRVIDSKVFYQLTNWCNSATNQLNKNWSMKFWGDLNIIQDRTNSGIFQKLI